MACPIQRRGDVRAERATPPAGGERATRPRRTQKTALWNAWRASPAAAAICRRMGAFWRTRAH
eukprot:7138693-Pyramimonas_sp.AAC.1